MLRNPRLRRLLLAFAALNVSEWSFVTALSIHAYRAGGTLAVGLIGLRLLAGAVSSAVLAPLFDRRKWALPAVGFARAVLLAAAAALVLSGVGFGFVLVLVVVDSVAAAAYRPAQSRLLPSLCRSLQELTQAAAGISMVKTLGQAGGALLGGLLADFTSPGKVMVGAAVLMLIAVIASFGLGRSRTPGMHRDQRSLLVGLRAFPEVLRDRLVWLLVAVSVLRTLVRGLWTALLVVVALRLLRLGGSGVGVLQAAAAVGAAIAVPVVARRIGRPRLALSCAISFIGAGITVSAIGLIPSVGFAVLLVCAWGTSMAIADATSLSLLHRLLSGGALSRTVSVMESLKLSAEGIGALLAPALVAIFGLRPALVIAGLPLPVLVALSWTRLQRSDLRGAGRGRLVAMLHALDIFRGLDMASIEDLTSRLEPLNFQAGVEVITQGAEGDRFYLVESGELEVLIDGYAIGRLGAGRGFGERALLRDSPRTATVRTVTPVALYGLDRPDFLSAVTGFNLSDRSNGTAMPAVRRPDPASRPLPELLAELTSLAAADSESLAHLAEVAVLEHHATGETVFREGEPSDAMYVILSGRAQVTVGDRVVSDLQAGDAFGEIGVLHRTTRTATVAALEDLQLVVLTAAAVREATADRDDGLTPSSSGS